MFSRSYRLSFDVLLLTDYCSSISHIADKDSLSLLRADLRAQRKLAKSLKKKSLWSRNLEEVVFSSFVNLSVTDKICSC